MPLVRKDREIKMKLGDFVGAESVEAVSNDPQLFAGWKYGPRTSVMQPYQRDIQPNPRLSARQPIVDLGFQCAFQYRASAC